MDSVQLRAKTVSDILQNIGDYPPHYRQPKQPLPVQRIRRCLFIPAFAIAAMAAQPRVVRRSVAASRGVISPTKTWSGC